MTVEKIDNMIKKHLVMLYINAEMANGHFDCSVLLELLNN